MTNDKSDKLTDGSHMAPDDDQQEIDPVSYTHLRAHETGT